MDLFSFRHVLVLVFTDICSLLVASSLMSPVSSVKVAIVSCSNSGM